MKRSFTLIEILLALGVLALVGFHVFENPTRCFYKKIALLKEMEMRRCARLTLLESKLIPYRWIDLTIFGKTFPLDDQTLDLPGIGPFVCHRKVFLQARATRINQVTGRPVQWAELRVTISSAHATDQSQSEYFLIEKDE